MFDLKGILWAVVKQNAPGALLVVAGVALFVAYLDWERGVIERDARERIAARCAVVAVREPGKPAWRPEVRAAIFGACTRVLAEERGVRHE